MTTQTYKQNVKYGADGRKEVYEERTTHQDPVKPVVIRTSRYSGIGILYVLLDIVEGLLAIRLILRLLVANPGNSFVALMYNITAPLIAPFRSAFASTVSQGAVIEWSTVLAMIVYALIVFAIVELVDSI